ncbi:MAG: hypothetical protein R3300_00650 [Candidatus Promineifilaceae bacterium]|nr:hypothetical protein [Candidatus Promineifilaceae bacterium]
MDIERIRPTLIQIRLHPYELAALVAAARWVAGDSQEELPQNAVAQLKQVLQKYEGAMTEPVQNV